METIYEVGGELVFAGTLLDSQAASKSGRIYLDEFCKARDVRLSKFRNINEPDAIQALRDADLDWLFIIGWSQIARAQVLGIPRRGVLGMHPTLLPIGRGRAAIPWAILFALEETGVSLFKLDGGVDTGPIVGQVRIPMGPRETATSLYSRVNEAHRTLIRQHWQQIANGTVTFLRQDESKATVWPGRTPGQGRLDASMTVSEADRLVRATTRPYPGAFVDLDGRRLRIWESSLEIQSHGLRLPFRDGLLQVIEFEWEHLPTAT